MTVVDRVEPVSTNLAISQSNHPRADALASGDPELMVLQLIKEDPFYSIGEIKGEINDRSEQVTVRWWTVFSILKRNGLLSRRARYRYARNRL